MTIKEFEKHVRSLKREPRKPGQKIGCKLWDRGCDGNGYPVIYINGIQYRGNRLVLELKLGRKIRKDFWSLHTCDNKKCVEKCHVYEGTVLDNNRDKVKRNRCNQPKGDEHYSRKYPEKLARGDRHGSRTHPERRAFGDRHGSRTHPEKFCVLNRRISLQIQRLYKTGKYTHCELAKEFGVSTTTIRIVVINEHWATRKVGK